MNIETVETVNVDSTAARLLRNRISLLSHICLMRELLRAQADPRKDSVPHPHSNSAALKETQTGRRITLNNRWRVRLDDPLQWILERRQRSPTEKSDGYTGRSYCIQRRSLLRDIGDYCGEVDPIALRQVEELPERIPYTVGGKNCG